MLFNKGNCCNRAMGYGNMGGYGQMECPIIEPTINKCVEKQFFHQVPQE